MALPRQLTHPRALDEVHRADAAQVAAEARLFLTQKGVSLDGRQETKTKAALTYFSKQLRAAAAA